MNHPVILSLIALLAPVGSFLAIAILFPLRRSGKPAALVSIAAVITSLVAAVMLWTSWHNAGLGPIHAVWSWLPAYSKSFAFVGVMIDGQSTLMLMLVTLVA